MIRFLAILLLIAPGAQVAFADTEAPLPASPDPATQASAAQARDGIGTVLQSRLDRLAAIDIDLKIADAELTGLLAALRAAEDPKDRAALLAAFEAASLKLRDTLARFDAEIARLDDLKPREEKP